MPKRTILLLIALFMLVSGCGLKGDLYLPGDETETSDSPTGSAVEETDNSQQNEEQGEDNGTDS